MNISPINLAAEPQTVVKPEENFKKYAMKDAPIPEPKDEVSFGSFGMYPKLYDKFIGQAASKKITRGSALNAVWENLFDSMNKYIFEGFFKKATTNGIDYFDDFKALNHSTSVRGTFAYVRGQKPKFSTFSPEFEEKMKDFAYSLKKNGRIVMAESQDGVPVFEIRYNKAAEKVKRGLSGIQDNVYEMEFRSPAGDMGCTFGVDSMGRYSLKQTNFGKPRYTSFDESFISDSVPRLMVEGKNAQVFNADGSLNWFKSLLLKLCYKN
ncbi:hypothetical protein J6S88_06980 [bacterium]|nr:hypothetical protein [bacterium]